MIFAGTKRYWATTDRLTDQQRTATWMSASILLRYPDAGLAADLILVDRASSLLPESVAVPLRQTLGALRECSLLGLQSEYVETFDNRKRHSLYLTYFLHGDTRKRGMALLRFKQVYQAAGAALIESGDTELPDHLCVALEFAATVDPVAGQRLLTEHRAGLEVLRLGLADQGSAWAGAVAAVSATLPAIDADGWDVVRTLAAQGPPEEEVGLAPYAPAGPVMLPEPRIGGR